jgi:hypothetical protein
METWPVFLVRGSGACPVVLKNQQSNPKGALQYINKLPIAEMTLAR